METRVGLEPLPWVLTRAPKRDQGPNWDDTIPASIPGNIVNDLHQAGLVPDPYYAENYRACQWTEAWTFWYKTEFTLEQLGLSGALRADERLVLAFDGLDTFAEIFANDQPLQAVHNMFRRYELDVTELLLAEGTNQLVVRIDPPLAEARKWADENGIDIEQLESPAFGYKERLVTRKAQMSYGWDQTPTLLAGGIFRPVYLVRRSTVRLEALHWHVSELELERKTAVLTVQGKVERPFATACTIRVRGNCGGNSAFAGSAELVSEEWSVRIPVEEALFWWPSGMGEAHLYSTVIQLVDAEGVVQNEKLLEIGLRTIEVKTTPTEKRMVDYRIGLPHRVYGMDGGAIGPWDRVLLEEPTEVEVSPFKAFVNGQPVFLKGFNWQNPEAMIGCTTPEKVLALVEAAKGTNANMLRLWGGGAIEIDAFYETCSREGLLVWQDFYFACASYPKDSAFLQEVEVEAAEMIVRLRHHTCLAAWCGDNESDMGDYDRNRPYELNPINKRLLPDLLKVYDSQGRYYHPSSPSGGPYPRSDWGGDKRNWGAWYPHHNYRSVRQESARIISEGGGYVFPGVDAISRFIPEAVRWPLTTHTWRLHHGDVERQSRTFLEGTLAAMRFHGEFDNLEQAVEVSQFAHAWGNKLLAERCRQTKPECGGVLLWKFAPCWPCVDGMFVDYELTPILSYDYIREAYKPVAVSLTQPFHSNDSDLQLYAVNDEAEQKQGNLTCISIEVRDGICVRTGTIVDKAVTVPAFSSQMIGEYAVEPFDRDRTLFLARLELADGRISYGAYSLEPHAAYRAMRALTFQYQAAEALFAAQPV